MLMAETLRLLITDNNQLQTVLHIYRGNEGNAIAPLTDQPETTKTPLYDLSGRKVKDGKGKKGKGRLKQGIYILGGKKIVVK